MKDSEIEKIYIDSKTSISSIIYGILCITTSIFLMFIISIIEEDIFYIRVITYIVGLFLILYGVSLILRGINNIRFKKKIENGLQDEEEYKRVERITKVIYIISEYIRGFIAVVLTLIILGTIVYTAIGEKRYYLLPVALVPFVIMIYVMFKKIKRKK